MGKTENDGFGNWCPDCGEPRGVCRCADEPYEPTAFDDDIASLEFDEMEDLLTCPTCEAVDVQWVGGDNVVNLSGHCSRGWISTHAGDVVTSGRLAIRT